MNINTTINYSTNDDIMIAEISIYLPTRSGGYLLHPYLVCPDAKIFDIKLRDDAGILIRDSKEPMRKFVAAIKSSCLTDTWENMQESANSLLEDNLNLLKEIWTSMKDLDTEQPIDFSGQFSLESEEEL